MILQPVAAVGESAQSSDQLFDLCDSSDTYNDIDNAVRNCDAALSHQGITDQQRARAHFRRGEAFYWAQRLDSALADLNAALAIDPGLAEARVRRAWTNWRGGQYAPALAEVTELLSLDDSNPDALVAYGYMVWTTPVNAERAVAAFEQAVSINPNHYLARIAFADGIFFGRAETEAGFAELDKLIALGRERLSNVRYWARYESKNAYDFYAHLRQTRAEWYERTSQPKRALADYDWLTAAYPDVALAHARRARVLRRLSDFTGALRAADRAIELDQWGEDQQSLRLEMLHYLNRPDDILTMSNNILEKGASDSLRGVAFYYRGLVRKQRGEYDSALDDVENAFRLEPFYLRVRLQRLAKLGYYDGKDTDEYSEAARNGLRACMIDPEC